MTLLPTRTSGAPGRGERAGEPARNPLLPPTPAPTTPAEPPVEPSALLGEQVCVTAGPQHPIDIPAPEQGAGGLGFAPVRADPPVWVVGLHGGCGATTVQVLLGAGAELRGRWPRPAVAGLGVPRVLLVARTHARGLELATAAATQWAANVTGCLLVGLIVTDDAPQVPKPLREQVQRLTSMVPALWHLPWQEQLRTDATAPSLGGMPRRVRKTIGSIQQRATDASAALQSPRPAGGPVAPDPAAWVNGVKPRR